MSFTFFTTLSNVALDIVLVVFIVLDMILLVTGKDYKNNRLYMLKFLMTLSITLTCLVYMIILGPTSDDGLIGAYLHNHAGSLGVHLIGPVFAIQIFLYLIKDLKQERYMQYTRLYHRFAMWVLYTYLQYLGLGGRHNDGTIQLS